MTPVRRYPIVPILLSVAAGLGGCRRGGGAASVDIIARDYAFQAPDSIPSGWTRFTFENQGQEHHFFLLHRLPDGKTLADYGTQVGVPFDSVWHVLQAGADKAEAGALLGSLLPDWFADVHQMGGAGLVAPGHSEQVMIELEPGYYVIECYVKSKEGVFHGSLGMARPLIVTDERSPAIPPDADLDITLTNTAIRAPERVSPGTHTIAVHFQERPAVGLGNDVHVVRVGEGASLDEVMHWMDWMNVDGLRTPAPAEFLGGLQEMPVGDSGFFTVALDPGRYAWISEQPAGRGMVQPFTVE